jgi:hypothetical protein
MGRFRPHKMYPGALLAQEACTYQANCELLAQMRGDMVVLIHSDRDCSNVLPKTRGRIHAHHPYKFLCTNMSEDEMVTGMGNRKLRDALELVTETYKPELIVVLSTCPTVMIGDNIKNVTRKASKELGVRAVAQITHGLKPKSPAEVVDKLYTTLIKQAQRAEGEVSKRVNLVGIGMDRRERREIEDVLAAMGLTVNTVLDERAELGDFLRVGEAGFNVHPGPHMLLDFSERCDKHLGIASVEVPLPYGVTATDAFYAKIAQACGVNDATLQRATEALRNVAIAARDGFTEKLPTITDSKPTLGYNIGSVRSFDLRRIALEELGEVPMMRELGFDIRLFIQGPQHEANWDRTAGVLQELGIELPFVLFPDPGLLVHFLRDEAERPTLFYGARFMGDQLLQVNVPLVHHRETRMGYGGMAVNCALLEAALGSGLFKHFEEDVFTGGGTELLDEMRSRGKGTVRDKGRIVPTDGLSLGKGALGPAGSTKPNGRVGGDA